MEKYIPLNINIVNLPNKEGHVTKKKSSTSEQKKAKYHDTYVMCEFIKETIYKQTMSPTGMITSPDSEVSSCDLLTPGSHCSTIPSDSDNRDCKFVKEKVKLVVGDLENVLGELKTVVGDIRVLVNQIDVVTEKIDKEYGVELRTSDICDDIVIDHRRKSTSAITYIDDQNNQAAVNVRHSVAHPYDLKYTKPDWLYLDIGKNAMSPNKRSDRNKNGSGSSNSSHKKRNVRSSDTSGCVVSSRDSQNGNVVSSSQQRSCSDKSDSKDSGTPSHKRNRKSKSERNRVNHLDDQSVEFSDLSPEDYVKKHRTKSENSLNPHHTHCSPCSPSPEGEYCGVYERELEMKLELEYDDNLSNYNGIDEQNSFELESFKDFKIRYRDNLNNMWSAYTIGPLDIRDIELENDPFLDDSATDISSDILNDNLAESSTSHSNCGGLNSWGASFDSSDIG